MNPNTYRRCEKCNSEYKHYGSSLTKCPCLAKTTIQNEKPAKFYKGLQRSSKIKSKRIRKNLYKLTIDVTTKRESRGLDKKNVQFGFRKEEESIGSSKTRTRKRISPVSKKQGIINSALQKVYEKISKERGHWCESCGKSTNLSFSHSIPRSKRKDLELDADGIFIQCMGDSMSCHYCWEHQTLKCLEFKNLDKMLLWVKSKDEARYLFIINKLNYQIEYSK